MGLLWLLASGSSLSAAPLMGLAYQPYVGQWSRQGDNPFAPGRFYTPAFNSYSGGIQLEDSRPSLLRARQTLDLYLGPDGALREIRALGGVSLSPEALRGVGPSRWSHAYFNYYEGRTAKPATEINHQASVYRQLAFLADQAGGAPLTLATYGAGYLPGYWRRIGDREYAALQLWTDNRTRFHPANGATASETRSIDRISFYFPLGSAYVRAAPTQALIESDGTPGRDLALRAVHQTIFVPARKGEPGARLSPGLFAGDSNAQVAIAAAEINARAGRRLLAVKQGVENIVLDGSLINDRMRFAILSALAQAESANARFPGTVTHLILTNEYARVERRGGPRPTSTQQILEMARFTRSQMDPGGDFEGLDLAIGVRGHHFRAVDPDSSDPAVRDFTRDVAALLGAVDFLMENIYPSPEAVAAASQEAGWHRFFGPAGGELSIQWRDFVQTIRRLARERPVELMVGETGHPTEGLSFNLPGYTEDLAAIPEDSAFARVAGRLDPSGTRIEPDGISVLQTYFNDRLAAAFVREACAWSIATGVQIHLFEAFDEPHKSARNAPPGDPRPRAWTLSSRGGYGAEAFFGLFGYTGVATFSEGQAPVPGALLRDALPAGLHWAGPFDGRLYAKLPGIDLAETAAAFETVTPP